MADDNLYQLGGLKNNKFDPKGISNPQGGTAADHFMNINIHLTQDQAEQIAAALKNIKIGTVTTGDAGSAAAVEAVTENNVTTLNISIPQGNPGTQGIQGVQGPQGEPGAQGEQGPAGAAGPAGPKGNDGVSLSIQDGEFREPGSTKDLSDLPAFADTLEGWAYVVDDDAIDGQYDLYMHTSGGTDWSVINNWAGVPGPQGKQGTQGIQGAKGDTGAQGIQGIQGKQGVAGAVGAKGDKGDKGDTGPQGPAGPKGGTGYPYVSGVFNNINVPSGGVNIFSAGSISGDSSLLTSGNRRFTATEKGIYLLNFRGGNVSTNMTITITKNYAGTTSYPQSDWDLIDALAPSSDTSLPPLTCLIALNAGDYLVIHVHNFGTSAITAGNTLGIPPKFTFARIG